MPDSNNTNLPIIEENSLHRIAKRVKKWQLITPKPSLTEYSCSSEIDQGLFDIEEYYEYEDKDFNLIYDKKLKKFLPIGEYLRVYLDNKDENILKIESIKPFYWKEWNFEEDIERVDFNAKVGRTKRRIGENTLGVFTQSAADFYQNNFDNTSDFYVKYDFGIKFNSIKIGNISLAFIDENSKTVNIYFKEDFSFKYITFEGGCYFTNTIFEKKVWLTDCNFEETKFLSCKFSENIFLSASKFNKMLEFIKTTFNSNENTIAFNENKFFGLTTFDSCVFKKLDFFESHFYKITKFNNCFISDLSFSNNYFKEDIYFKRVQNIENAQEISISFSDSTFSQKLYFSLANDSKENYQNLTLNLYHASFGDFVCDDRNLAETNLHYSDRNGNFTNGNEKKKDDIERAIAERRVFRKILQDLHWGDKADEEYAKIMDLQLKLDFLENDGAAKLKQFFFGWWLGWGVRILNWKFWKGGIVWSSLFLCFIFWVISFFGDFINSFYSTPPNNCSNTTLCRLVNLVFSSNAIYFGDIVIVILGFIQLTLILVILARKFMRM